MGELGSNGFIQPISIVDSSGHAATPTLDGAVYRVPVSAVVTSTTAINVVVMAAPAQVSVGVVSTVVLAANALRTYFMLSNDSSGIMYLGYGALAVVGRGPRLAPGQSIWMDSTAITRQAINAISTVAASNMGVQEGTA